MTLSHTNIYCSYYNDSDTEIFFSLLEDFSQHCFPLLVPPSPYSPLCKSWMRELQEKIKHKTRSTNSFTFYESNEGFWKRISIKSIDSSSQALFYKICRTTKLILVMAQIQTKIQRYEEKIVSIHVRMKLVCFICYRQIFIPE